jgi:hypothetical protein
MLSYPKNNYISSLGDKFRNNDENFVILFTNARDEPNIAEWIAHHLLLGFDKIIIFDHMSKQPIRTTLNTNFNNKVEIIEKTGTGNIKEKLGKEAVQIAKNLKASWMLYLDADEFLLLNKYTNVKQFLSKFKFADAIGINWLMFGTSHHKIQPKGLLTENFVMCDKLLNKHVKSFVRPESVTLSKGLNPHFYYIINPNRYFAATGNRMKPNPFNDVKRIFTQTISYIAHYYVQSEEEYIRRKCRKPDNGTHPRSKDFNFNTHNEVMNNQLQYKYSQKIKDFLQNYNIVL